MPFPVNNIRMACKRKGITLAELERELQIGNGIIAKWEKAKRFPPHDRLLAIANFLGVTVDELLGKEKAPTLKIEDERTEKFVNLFSQLTEQEQDLFLAQIKGVLSQR